MLQRLLELLGVALVAAVSENAVFTRALGDGALPYNRFTPRQAVYQGCVMTVASVLAALSGWLGEAIIDQFYFMPTHLRPPVFMMVFILFFMVVYHTLDNVKWFAPWREQIALHPLIVFGFIPVSTMLFIGYGAYTLPEALFYGLGVGGGYLLAMLLTYVLRERSWFIHVPKAFQGFPVALVYTGLVSLALFGLLGHQPAM